MPFDTDVIVLGAGPVGLTLANELRRHGATARIVDRASGVREVSKALILHVRTQEVLDHVGVARRARAEAEPLTEVVVHAYGKAIGSWDLDDIDSPFRHPLILGQNRTQHLLIDRLAEQGGAVEWNTEALSVAVDAEGVTAELAVTDPATGEGRRDSVRARYAVGCEGSASVVRRTLGLTFEGERYAGEQFIQADCRIRWALPKGRSYLFLTEVGYLMVIEFPGDLVRIFISLPDGPGGEAGAREAAGQLGAAESATEVPTLEEVREALVRLSGFDCELSEPGWLARYRTSHRYANRFSVGRAFIAGDAAHVHVPIGGQGMNTGIQDAFNLGWKLAGVATGALRPDILQTYHAERHPVAEGLIRGTNFAYRGILHPSQARQHAARLFGPFLIGARAVQGFMRDTLEELRVFYPDSPLNLDLGGTRGPRPGERVLDAALVAAQDRATTSIAEITRGPHWTLLLFGGAPGADTAALTRLAQAARARAGRRLVAFMILADRDARGVTAPNANESGAAVMLDALEIAHHRYGVAAPAFYLLRPDTYIAARGPIHRADNLLTYLDRVLG